MAEGAKKISFGFSKLSKSSLVSKPKKDNVNGIQYIDCLESKSIKVKGSFDKDDTRELVIPLRNKQSSTQIVQNNADVSRSETSVTRSVKNFENGVSSSIPESLDIIAAREIIQDLERKKDTEHNNLLTLPLNKNVVQSVTDRAPTLEDYESIPVNDFGIALLRGMGWSPGKGIGKNEKVAQCSGIPVLRPKGMGLGADKLVSKPVGDVNEEDELKLLKGGFVKVIAGSHKDMYGQVEGFDEDGRVILKSFIGKTTISVLESLVKTVPESEYKRHARVINLSKYEEEKRKESVSSHSEHKRRKKNYEDS